MCRYVIISLLLAALVKYSEQGEATCNNATFVQCSAIQPAWNMPATIDLPTATAFCSNATTFSSCISNMNCQSTDSFSFDSSYVSAKGYADTFSFLCASGNPAVWAANSMCIATGSQMAYQWCYNSLGAANIPASQYCSFYQSLYQCTYNQAILQCNQASAALATSMLFFSVKASMALTGCNLTLPSSSSCTSCNLQCSYGIQLDTMSCPICSSGCINPCQNVTCQQSQVCVPVCNSPPTGGSCSWTGTCVPNGPQQCVANSFSQCVEPPPYYPNMPLPPFCSQVAVFDRCIHLIACNNKDQLYPMFVSGLWKSSNLKSQCALANQQGVTAYGQNYMCAGNAYSAASTACNSQVNQTITDPCVTYSQLFQCTYNALKNSCNTDAANLFMNQQVLITQSILANSSMSCTFAQPWASPCTSCSTTCQYGYATDAIGCNDCNKCKSATSGGISSVQSTGLVWWKTVVYLLVSIIAAAMM